MSQKINFTVRDIMDLHYFFCQSFYGEELAQCQRFGLYMPKWMSGNDWEDALGLDVNNREHPLVNLILAEDFIDDCNNPPPYHPYKIDEVALFTNFEKKIVLLACIIHDMAESVKGDKLVFLKTDKDVSDEYVLARVLCDEIAMQFKNGEFRDRINQALEEVVISQETKLGKAFFAIEKMGYLRTGLKAWQYSKGLKSSINSSFVSVTASVLIRNLIFLLEEAKIFPGTYVFLFQQKEKISDFFNNFKNRNDLLFFPEENPEAFLEVKKIWKEFLQKCAKF